MSVRIEHLLEPTTTPTTSPATAASPPRPAPRPTSTASPHPTIRALHPPGHLLEHTAFALIDTARGQSRGRCSAATPLFVGDIPSGTEGRDRDRPVASPPASRRSLPRLPSPPNRPKRPSCSDSHRLPLPVDAPDDRHLAQLAIISAISALVVATHLLTRRGLEIPVTLALMTACVVGGVAGTSLAGRVPQRQVGHGFATMVAAVAAYPDHLGRVSRRPARILTGRRCPETSIRAARESQPILRRPRGAPQALASLPLRDQRCFGEAALLLVATERIEHDPG